MPRDLQEVVDPRVVHVATYKLIILFSFKKDAITLIFIVTIVEFLAHLS